MVKEILHQGTAKAAQLAKETMEMVREAMRIKFT